MRIQKMITKGKMLYSLSNSLCKITTGIYHVSQQNVSKLIRNRFDYLPVGKDIAKNLLDALYVKCFELSRNRLQIIVSYTKACEFLVNLFHHS